MKKENGEYVDDFDFDDEMSNLFQSVFTSMNSSLHRSLVTQALSSFEVYNLEREEFQAYN